MFAFEGREPRVSPSAWIAPTATLIGDVLVEDDASIWYGAILRADFGPIVVRRGANVQDGSVLHGGADPVTEVGEGATVGHLCVVHGAVIHAEALIGNGATVLDGAVVGRQALVAAGATVPPGMKIGERMLAAGVPAKVIREISGGARDVGRDQPRGLPRAGPAARGRRPSRARDRRGRPLSSLTGVPSRLRVPRKPAYPATCQAQPVMWRARDRFARPGWQFLRHREQLSHGPIMDRPGSAQAAALLRWT